MRTQKDLTIEDSRKIAKLVNLSLSNEELERFSKLFGQTIEYINVLDELDVSEVQETNSVTGLLNVFSTPENLATLSQEEALSNASKVIDRKFVTKAVFER